MTSKDENEARRARATVAESGEAPGERRVLPLVALTFYGGFKGIQLALDQPVRNLEVEGTFQRVTPIQVEAAVAGSLNAGFMTIDLGKVRDRVQELDWVDRVNVGRRWLDTLIVRVTEHQAAARWGETGLLNVRGELFTERSQHAFAELPSLAGPPAMVTRGTGWRRRYLSMAPTKSPMSISALSASP